MSTRALAEALAREVDLHDGRPARRVLNTDLRLSMELRVREFLRQKLRLADSDMALLRDEQANYREVSVRESAQAQTAADNKSSTSIL